jgi:hypothetical protein
VIDVYLRREEYVEEVDNPQHNDEEERSEFHYGQDIIQASCYFYAPNIELRYVSKNTPLMRIC